MILDPAAGRLPFLEMFVRAGNFRDVDDRHFGDHRCTPAGLALSAAGGVASSRGQAPTSSARLAISPLCQPLGRAQLPDQG
jgi:hypothetical protein